MLGLISRSWEYTKSNSVQGHCETSMVSLISFLWEYTIYEV